MKEYKNTKSTVNPEPLIIDDCSAWVCENVAEFENDGLVEYEYDMYQYGKDEYIKMISEKSAQLEIAQWELSDALSEIVMGV